MKGPILCKKRTSRSRRFFRMGVFKNFVMVTGKHLWRSLFLIRVQACNFTEKWLQQRCFPVNIGKCLRTASFVVLVRRAITCDLQKHNSRKLKTVLLVAFNFRFNFLYLGCSSNFASNTKRINQLPFPLKLERNLRFSDSFGW